MNEQDFKKALNLSLKAALECSLKWNGFKNHPKQPNAYRSQYFCYQVGKHLDSSIKKRFPQESLVRKLITFDENHEKVTGEWLLDVLWCDDVQPVRSSKFKHASKIFVALECESSTSPKSFFEDFAKLVHVYSDIKIFLAGVDQIREPFKWKYIERRTTEAAQFLNQWARDLDREEWYLAFWPSPKDGRWDCLEKYPHLRQIVVFDLRDGTFVEI